ncbi:MAG: hypothetical protein ACR2M0_11615 [Chloroflexia bacterium]
MATKWADLSEARRWNRVYLLLYVGYIALGMSLRWNGWLHFDHIWFVDAARHVLDGSWRIYEFRATPSIAPPDGLAYSYSPLTAMLMAPFVAVADALKGTPLAASVGGTDQLAYRLIVFPLLVADVLAMEQLRRIVREWRPDVDEAGIFLGILPTLLLTSFLLVSAYRDHQEGLVLLLLLTTLRVTPRRLLLGGVCAGLTLAAKQTSLLELLPVGTVLLWQGRFRLRDALIWGAAAVGVFGAFLLPPFLADRDALIYALITQEQRRILTGQGLPVWIDAALANGLGIRSAEYALWHDRLLRYSNPALVMIAVALVLAALWWAGRRGRPIGLRDSRLLALVAVGGLLQIVLAKWVTGHYYQLPLALALLWDIVRRAPLWPAVGLAGTVGFRLVAAGLHLPDGPLGKDGAIFFLFLWLTLAALFAAFGREPQSRPATQPVSDA